MVARAWVNPEYKALLLSDGNAAAKELGIDASNVNAPTVLTVVENTHEVLVRRHIRTHMTPRRKQEREEREREEDGLGMGRQ